MKETNEAIRKSADEAAKANKAQKVSWTEINSAIVLVRQGLELVKKGYDFAKEGAEIEFIKTRFDNLAVSINTTSELLLGDLRTATRGMYSDMELMASATDFVGLGLAKTHDEAVRLAAVSAGLNMNMNQLVLTLTNMTTMRFDALGVRVDGFKEKVKELEKAGYSADAAFKEAFLQQAEAQLILVGNAADTSAGQFMKFEAEIKNTTDAMKQQAGTGLLPFIENLNDEIEKTSVVSAVMRFGFDDIYKGLVKVKDATSDTITQEEIIQNAVNAVTSSLQDKTEALKDLGEEIILTEEQIKELEEQTKALTKANRDELNTLGDLTDKINSYKDKQTELKDKQAELLAEKEKLIKDGWWEESEKIQEVNDKLADNAQAQQENVEAFQLATNQRILSRAEELLSIDGLTTEEKNGLIERGIAMGVYTAEAAARMKEEEAAAVSLTAALMGIPSSISTTITTNYVNQGVPTYVAQNYAPDIPHAEGGTFMIPQSYGNEGFKMGNKDTASGGELVSITPRGQSAGSGATININVSGGVGDPEEQAQSIAQAVRHVLRQEGVAYAQ